MSVADPTQTEIFDGVILATPARAAASLLAAESEFEALRGNLDAIETASSAIVVMGIDTKYLQQSFNGYGIIYPHSDGGDVIALSFSSNKFAGRAPEGKVLVRCFIGGALRGELVDRDDAELIAIATRQMSESIGLGGSPDFADVFRWRNCMPQYHLGHLDRVTAIDATAASYKSLAFCGNSYHGVGIPACIASGNRAAESMFALANAG